MRADVYLVTQGHASTRSQAQRLIAAGVRWRLATSVDWVAIHKNGDTIPADAEIELLDASEARYVSRGGLKLEGALDASSMPVTDRRCLDVGQSTGGFTDCLLRRGAAQMVGIDVGTDQIHPSIRADDRVTVIEGVNARSIDATEKIADSLDEAGAAALFESKFDLIVGDLSFISLTLVLPALVPLLQADGDFLLLVKPQFELQPGQVGKGGIVRDTALFARVEKRIRTSCADLGLVVVGWMPSVIAGADGNQEFFVHARLSASAAVAT